ncbi:hypothetical protein HDU93_008846 [Gonapodya sp. JEL0774]|nr:hypothetical protein HDU93_008846 [Gonapodya sp. JEL0774]
MADRDDRHATEGGLESDSHDSEITEDMRLQHLVQAAEIGPDGMSITFVVKNDLYNLRPIDSLFESAMARPSPIRITTTGAESLDRIFNGVPDWVYEEELGHLRTFWHSPEDKAIAFLSINASEVPAIILQYYDPIASDSSVPDPGPANATYPRTLSVRYPKAGAPNPSASLYVWSPPFVTSGVAHKPGNVLVPVSFDPQDLPIEHLIVSVHWILENELLVRIAPRTQDSLLYFVASVDEETATWSAKLVRTTRPDDGGWIDPMSLVVRVALWLRMILLCKHSHFVNLPYSIESCEQVLGDGSYVEVLEDSTGYAHLAYFSSFASQSPSKWLTSGAYEVASVVALANSTVAYTYAPEPHLRAATVLDIETGHSTPLIPEDQSEANNWLEGWVEVGRPSLDKSHLVVTRKGPEVPKSWVIRTTGRSKWSLLEDNGKLRNWLLARDTVEKKVIQIPTVDGLHFNALIFTPPNFDASGAKRYPVIMRCYGGPTSQVATTQFSLDVHVALASLPVSEAPVILQVDGRGTGFSGRAFRLLVSGNLGDLEAVDQAAAAEWVKKQPWSDGRVGIWGWSFGGYLTTRVIERYGTSNLFQAAVAVAPVTSWHYYDSVYTERYMRLPLLNPHNYTRSAVHNVTSFITPGATPFLLMHGTADDNVHPQNSLALTARIDRAGSRGSATTIRWFPDSDHRMNSQNGHALQIVYSEMSSWMWKGFFGTHCEVPWGENDQDDEEASLDNDLQTIVADQMAGNVHKRDGFHGVTLVRRMGWTNVMDFTESLS